jgi:hypothetical protein
VPVEEQPGDQESRQDEEEIDSELPGRGKREVGGVVEDDRRDRDCAKSVERALVSGRQV